jgi:hypothetical protein
MKKLLKKYLWVGLLTLAVFGFGMPRSARACPS